MGHWEYRPLLLAETGAEGGNGAGWLCYVGGEVRAALRAGAPIQGVCLYPVMDYPGWDDERHCRSGLIHTGGDWGARTVDSDMLERLAEERELYARAGVIRPAG